MEGLRLDALQHIPKSVQMSALVLAVQRARGKASIPATAATLGFLCLYDAFQSPGAEDSSNPGGFWPGFMGGSLAAIVEPRFDRHLIVFFFVWRSFLNGAVQHCITAVDHLAADQSGKVCITTILGCGILDGFICRRLQSLHLSVGLA